MTARRLATVHHFLFLHSIRNIKFYQLQAMHSIYYWM